MVNQIYPSELQLNKANSSDTEAQFLDLHLDRSDDFVSSKIYYHSFDSILLIFLAGDIPNATSNRGYISQLIQFARVSGHVAEFKSRNKILTSYINHSAVYILFWSFEFSGNILRNQK